MGKYILTNKAVIDLSRIWDYTYDQWSENQADKYYQALLDSFQEIANNPKIGRCYTGITESLFGINTNKHIIFYRIISENEIEITRVLHEMMDLKSRLKE